MAIEFARRNVLTRSKGHTAIKAAAYRAGEKLVDERLNQTVDYSHRGSEVGHSEILLPTNASAALGDRTTLWNAVEAREDQHNRRASAQLAVDAVIALPTELTKEQHIDIARRFAQEYYVSRGLVVDLAVHYHSEGNPHAHLMTTTRPVEGLEFKLKDRALSGHFKNGKKIPEVEQLRHKWAEFQNAYFAEHGIDAFVRNNDGDMTPEKHVGPARSGDSARSQDRDAAVIAREALVAGQPEVVIERVSERKSMFTSRDMYKELHVLCKDADTFADTKAKLDSHPDLISIKIDGKNFFTTRAVLEIEQDIRSSAKFLNQNDKTFNVPDGTIEKALKPHSYLSDEQTDAARYLLSEKRLGTVIGLAGTGKSTMLEVVNEAYTANGNTVHGIALSGKAAESLEESSGIESRTISSWIYALNNGKLALDKGDVVVLDEAGMVNNKTMKSIVDRVKSAGAKLIQIGDGEQLQPIDAGCPFRDIGKQEGCKTIGTIRRQKEAWQRDATKDLSEGNGHRAFREYDKRGHVQRFETSDNLREKLIEDYLSAEGTRAILAHRRKDIRALNQDIQMNLALNKDIGKPRPFRGPGPEREQETPLDLRPGDPVLFADSSIKIGLKTGDKGTYLKWENEKHHVIHKDGTTRVFDNSEYNKLFHQTSKEKDSTAYLGKGDRVLFTENNRTMGVKNGSLGTVLSHRAGTLKVQVDNNKEPIKFSHEEYDKVQLGYAATIHKSQGITVDHAFLMGSATMDKHLGYVGMSRHRDSLQTYLSKDAMMGKNFPEVISKSNRQETVLDVAKNAGLEFDGVRFSKRVTRQTVLDREQLMLNIDKRVADSGAAEQVRINEINDLVNRLDISLSQHMNEKPREGFMASKKAHTKWDEIKNGLQIDLRQAQKDLSAARSEFNMGSEWRRHEAEKSERDENPELSERINAAEDRSKAEQLIERWEYLENELADHDSIKVAESLTQVLKDIQSSEMAMEMLSDEEQSSLNESLEQAEIYVENLIDAKNFPGNDFVYEQ